MDLGKTEEVRKFLLGLPVKENYFSLGVYVDGSKKSNVVAAADLAKHIDYNLSMRPGRAFFVEGVCLNQGYLSREMINDLEGRCVGDINQPVSVPYQ